MKLILTRRPSKDGATIGTLLIDGVFECYTCEDVIREVPDSPVSEWKVAGKTAIPQGTYKVVITHSARFDRELPLLLDVPGFSGIRIHPGNTAADTEGCLLPGRAIGEDGKSVVQSKAAFEVLAAKIRAALAAGEDVAIEIRNP